MRQGWQKTRGEPLDRIHTSKCIAKH